MQRERQIWRGNNNIADSIFRQMQAEQHPVPSWIVMSLGTGGTSATIGRYIRYQKKKTRLCAVDPDHSVFKECYASGDKNVTIDKSSRIEGIGRPRVEPSFMPGVIDDMRHVPDAASIATIHWLQKNTGEKSRAKYRNKPLWSVTDC